MADQKTITNGGSAGGNPNQGQNAQQVAQAAAQGSLIRDMWGSATFKNWRDGRREKKAAEKERMMRARGRKAGARGDGATEEDSAYIFVNALSAALAHGKQRADTYYESLEQTRMPSDMAVLSALSSTAVRRVIETGGYPTNEGPIPMPTPCEQASRTHKEKMRLVRIELSNKLGSRSFGSLTNEEVDILLTTIMYWPEGAPANPRDAFFDFLELVAKEQDVQPGIFRAKVLKHLTEKRTFIPEMGKTSVNFYLGNEEHIERYLTEGSTRFLDGKEGAVTDMRRTALAVYTTPSDEIVEETGTYGLMPQVEDPEARKTIRELRAAREKLVGKCAHLEGLRDGYLMNEDAAIAHFRYLRARKALQKAEERHARVAEEVEYLSIAALARLYQDAKDSLSKLERRRALRGKAQKVAEAKKRLEKAAEDLEDRVPGIRTVLEDQEFAKSADATLQSLVDESPIAQNQKLNAFRVAREVRDGNGFEGVIVHLERARTSKDELERAVHQCESDRDSAVLELKAMAPPLGRILQDGATSAYQGAIDVHMQDPGVADTIKRVEEAHSAKEEAAEDLAIAMSAQKWAGSLRMRREEERKVAQAQKELRASPLVAKVKEAREALRDSKEALQRLAPGVSARVEAHAEDSQVELVSRLESEGIGGTVLSAAIAFHDALGQNRRLTDDLDRELRSKAGAARDMAARAKGNQEDAEAELERMVPGIGAVLESLANDAASEPDLSSLAPELSRQAKLAVSSARGQEDLSALRRRAIDAQAALSQAMDELDNRANGLFDIIEVLAADSARVHEIDRRIAHLSGVLPKVKALEDEFRKLLLSGRDDSTAKADSLEGTILSSGKEMREFAREENKGIIKLIQRAKELAQERSALPHEEPLLEQTRHVMPVIDPDTKEYKLVPVEMPGSGKKDEKAKAGTLTLQEREFEEGLAAFRSSVAAIPMPRLMRAEFEAIAADLGSPRKGQADISGFVMARLGKMEDERTKPMVKAVGKVLERANKDPLLAQIYYEENSKERRTRFPQVAVPWYERLENWALGGFTPTASEKGKQAAKYVALYGLGVWGAWQITKITYNLFRHHMYQSWIRDTYRETVKFKAKKAAEMEEVGRLQVAKFAWSKFWGNFRAYPEPLQHTGEVTGIGVLHQDTPFSNLTKAALHVTLVAALFNVGYRYLQSRHAEGHQVRYTDSYVIPEGMRSTAGQLPQMRSRDPATGILEGAPDVWPLNAQMLEGVTSPSRDWTYYANTYGLSMEPKPTEEMSKKLDEYKAKVEEKGSDSQEAKDALAAYEALEAAHKASQGYDDEVKRIEARRRWLSQRPGVLQYLLERRTLPHIDSWRIRKDNEKYQVQTVGKDGEVSKADAVACRKPAGGGPEVCDLIDIKATPITDNLKLDTAKADELIDMLMKKEGELPQKAWYDAAYDNVASSWLFRTWPVSYLGVSPSAPTDRMGYGNLHAMESELVSGNYLIPRSIELIRNVFGDLSGDEATRSAPAPTEEGAEAAEAPAPKPFDPILDNVTDEEMEAAVHAAVASGIKAGWARDATSEWDRQRIADEVAKIGLMPKDVQDKLMAQADMRAMLLHYVQSGSAHKLNQPKIREFVEHLEDQLKDADQGDPSLKAARRARVLELYDASVHPPGDREGRTDLAVNRGWISRRPLTSDGKGAKSSEGAKEEGKAGEVKVLGLDEAMTRFYSDTGPGGPFKLVMSDLIKEVYASRSDEEKKAFGSQERFVEHALAVYYELINEDLYRNIRKANGLNVEGTGDARVISLEPNAQGKLKNYLATEVNKLFAKARK